jgi:hypothetical protein
MPRKLNGEGRDLRTPLAPLLLGPGEERSLPIPNRRSFVAYEAGGERGQTGLPSPGNPASKLLLRVAEVPGTCATQCSPALPAFMGKLLATSTKEDNTTLGTCL